MPAATSAGSERRQQLLESSYRYVLAHGLSGMSLRPLAAAIGSSPRVLLFLFGSKEQLLRELLARAREDEVKLLQRLEAGDGNGLAAVGLEIWRWLSAPEHGGLLRLWVESYSQALIEPSGPWAGFAQATVRDWLGLLARAQPRAERNTAAGGAKRTLVLAILRGAMLDLLATGDRRRVTGAVRRAMQGLD